ncbi:hypothetical protein SRABI106_02480 [Rahnella aquatilis]|nr:hypothetical protein SRABI106_02480 [Rahnella aquatilis]
MQRHLIMGNGDHRFDAVRNTGINHLIIMLQPRFVRLLLNTVRVDAGPGDRKAVTFESHFREQRDIFLKAMIVIDAFMIGIRVVCSIKGKIKLR